MKKSGFTLAEVLITLGIIGVVAALTLPSLFQSVNNIVWNAREKNIKYKFSQATDMMLAKGELHSYDTTMDFVNVLANEMKLAKICDVDNIRSCWPTSKIKAKDGTEVEISTIRYGENLGEGEWITPVAGIITADGTPAIVTFNQECADYEDQSPIRYGSSASDSEDSNAYLSSTLSCSGFIFDINGANGPNQEGKDIKTINASVIGMAGVKVGNIYVFPEDSALTFMGNAKEYCTGGWRLPTPNEMKTVMEAQKKGLVKLGLGTEEYWALDGENLNAVHKYANGIIVIYTNVNKWQKHYIRCVK